jgi:hypothetical protein
MDYDGDGAAGRNEAANMAAALIRRGDLDPEELKEKLCKLVDLVSDTPSLDDEDKPGEEGTVESRGQRRRRLKAATLTNRELVEKLTGKRVRRGR